MSTLSPNGWRSDPPLNGKTTINSLEGRVAVVFSITNRDGTENKAQTSLQVRLITNAPDLLEQLELVGEDLQSLIGTFREPGRPEGDSKIADRLKQRLDEMSMLIDATTMP